MFHNPEAMMVERTLTVKISEMLYLQLEAVGLTAIGRATAAAIDLNRSL